MRVSPVRRFILAGLAATTLMSSGGCRSTPIRHQAAHRPPAPIVTKSQSTEAVSEPDIDATRPALSKSVRTRSDSPTILQASQESEIASSRQSPGTAKQPLFEIPSELPGADAAPLNLPPIDENESAQDRAAKINKLYRPLSTVRPARRCRRIKPNGTSRRCKRSHGNGMPPCRPLNRVGRRLAVR